jgi:hypothetical protein
VTGRTAVQHVYKGLACGSAQHTVTFDPPVRARRLRVAFPEAVNLSELEAFEPRRGPVRLMKWVADAAGRWPVFAAAYEDGTLLVLDTQGRLLWRATAREAITDAVLDDLDGDGQWELVIVTLEHQAHCFDARGQVRWSVPFLAKDLGECASPMSVGTAADPSSPPLVAPPQSPPTVGGKRGPGRVMNLP